MDDGVVALLERLLNQPSDSRMTTYLKKSRDFYDSDWTYEDVREIEAEFARDLRMVATQIEAVWGPPEFIGHRDASLFRNFHIFEELCYWRHNDQVAIIWWEHQDKELPVLLAMNVFRLDQLIP